MNNEDPIEIEFLINSPELLEQANQVKQGLQSVDNAVTNSESNFQQYINAQLEASNAISQNVKLTKEQQRAYDTYASAIAGLSKMIQEATDPTQISIYEFKIKEITSNINSLLSQDRKKIEVIDTVKLEEAGRLIDSISDKTFTPTFASNEELELLSQKINQATNEFEQLDVVINFVTARLGSIGDNDALISLKEDISQANKLLGNTVEQYDSTGNSINQMTDALKVFKEQLLNETDPKNIITLNQNIEDLEQRIKQVTNSGRKGFDDLGNTIEVQRETVRGLKGQLAQLVQQMAQMRLEGQQNTAQYRELSKQAKDLAGSLSTVNEEVRFSASASSGLDTIIRATKGVASGYALAQSASALFGEEQKDLQQTLVKITAVLSLLQGLQTIQLELARKDSLITKTLTYLKGVYAKVIGESTGALKGFKVALLSTGVGLAIVLIGELISNWDQLKKSIGLSSDELERNQEIGKKANSLYAEKIAKLQILATTNEKVALTEKQKKQAVKDYNSEFKSVLGSVKNYSELENKIINNVGNYIEYLNIKAQAEASYMLSLEKQKKLLEEITALSTGDLKWYESLQNGLDKFGEKFRGFLGSKTKGAKREISQEEVLSILNLPSKEAFNDAIKDYSFLVTNKLIELRKEKENNKGMLETSYELQKKAGELADKYKIEPDEKVKKTKDNAFKERIKALADIAKAEDEFAKKRLTGLQKDLIDIEQRYEKLRKEAKKAKVSDKDIKRIDNLEKQEIVSVKYTNDTDKLKKQLEESKRIYEEYEEFKKSTSEQKANETFKDLINTQKNYYDLLSDELDKINVNDMTAEAKQRYGTLTQMLIEYSESKDKIDRDTYNKLYQTTLSYEQRLTSIKDEYSKKRSDIERSFEGEDLKNRLKVLEKEYRKNLSSFFDSFLEDSGFTRNITESILGITKSQINAQIKSLESYLETTANLTEEQVSNIKNVINDLNSKLYNATDDPKISTLNQYNSEIKKTKDYIDYLEKKKGALRDIGADEAKNEIAKLNAEIDALNYRLTHLNAESAIVISGELNEITNYLSNASSLFTDVNSGVEKMLSNMSKATNIASQMVGSFAQMAKHSNALKDGTADFSSAMGAGGGYLGMFMSVVSIIDGAFSRAAKSQEEAAERRRLEMEKYYLGELEWQRKMYNYEIENRRREKLGLSSRRGELDAMYKDAYNREKQLIDIASKFQGDNVIIQKGYTGNGVQTGYFEKTNKEIQDRIKELEEIIATSNDSKAIKKAQDSLKFLKNDVLLAGKSWKELEKMLDKGVIIPELQNLVSEYVKLNKELEDAGYKIEDLKNAMRELVTGTSVEELSERLADAFKNGENAVESFGETMEDVLKNAVVSAFKHEYIIKEMDALFKVFGDMGIDGQYTEEELEQIRKLSKEAAERLQAQWDAINKGLDFGDKANDKNSLKGAIKGMTENQADLLAGQIGGWRLAQLETNSILTRSFTSQLELLSKQVAIQMQIEVNTRNTSGYTERTAKAVEELLSKSKTSPDVLKANGIWTN